MAESAPTPGYTRGQRALILAVAFLGWMFAGVIIGIMPMIVRASTYDFLRPHLSSAETVPIDRLPPRLRQHLDEQVTRWLSWHTCAFLLGAGAGGTLFGWLGDRVGRARALGWSILCYTLPTGLSSLARTPEELLSLRFLACLGVGGMWPNGVALVVEAWADVNRPFLAGLIGAAANFGMVLLGVVTSYHKVTPDDWRWVLVDAAWPAVLGLVALAVVPESLRWLAQRNRPETRAGGSPLAEVFRPPLLGRTVLGILLGAIPMLGTTVVAYWIIPWADQVGGWTDPGLKARMQIYRSSGGIVSSFLGGIVASLLGRRTTYFLISLASLVVAEVLYSQLTPADPWFPAWAFALGFCGVAYFGWLPLYLPELFPTRVRSTGAGVSFNLGRVAAVPIVLSFGLISGWFEGDYGRIGTWTSLVFALGLVLVFFAPDTSKQQLQD